METVEKWTYQEEYLKAKNAAKTSVCCEMRCTDKTICQH